MTSSCCTKRSRAAVPYSNLRGAIGTFHTGKSTDPSRKGSLPGHFLHREELRRCPPHSRGTQRTQARQFLQLGDATQELACQDRDAACYTTSLPGNFLHREELRRCPPHSRGTQRTGQARQFLPPGDATQELACQDRDAARYITSLPGNFLHQEGKLRRCPPYSRGPREQDELATSSRKVTLQRSSLTRIQTQPATLLCK